MVEENFPPLQSCHLLMYGPAIMVEFGCCDGDCCCCSIAQCVWLFVSPWTAAPQASLSIINSWSLLKPMSIESVIPSNHLILWSPSPPAFNFPSIRVFPNESVLCIRWPKDWSFSISLSNEYSGLISFRMDWLDLLADRDCMAHKALNPWSIWPS